MSAFFHDGETETAKLASLCVIVSMIVAYKPCILYAECICFGVEIFLVGQNVDHFCYEHIMGT